MSRTRVGAAMTPGEHSHLWPGVPAALASAALFGLATPLSKLLLASVGPHLLAGLLYLGAGIGLAAIRLGRAGLAGPSREARLHNANLPWLGAAILFGGVLGPVLLMAGLAHMPAAAASLLLNLESLATMSIAWLVFRENVDHRLLLGALAIVAGAVVLAWDGDGLALDGGAVLIAGACVCWGIDNNLTRKVSAADPVLIAMLKGLAAGVVNTVLAVWSGDALPPAAEVGAAAIVGLLGIGVSLVLFVHAMRSLGAARTGAYFSLAPFIGALFAIAVWREWPTARFFAAGGLMAVGLWLHLTERHEHAHEHAGLVHDHTHTHDEHHRHEHREPVTGPHAHLHRHTPLRHRHPHFPDLHHRHHPP